MILKKSITTLGLVLALLMGVAQTYSLRSRLNHEAAQHDAMLVKGDFIYTSGIVADTIPPYRTMNVFSKYDLEGNLMMCKTFKGDSGEYEIGTFENSLISTHDNGFALAGYKIMNNKVLPLVIKYDFLGDVQFYKSYPYSNSQYLVAKEIIEVADGYLIQAVNQKVNFDVDVCLMKIDLSGNLVWRKFYGTGSGDENASAFLKTSDNRLLIAGHSNNRKYSDYDLFISYSYLLLLDTAGNVVRDSIGTDPNIGIPQCVIETQDGNFVYSGSYAVLKDKWTAIFIKPYLAKVDSNFNLLWAKTYGDSSAEVAFTGLYNAKELSDGSLVSVGANYNIEIQPYFNQHHNGLIVKTDANGNQLWRREYRGVTRIGQQIETNILYDSEILTDGSIVACGIATDPNDTFPQQAWLLRVDADGCMENNWCGYTGIAEPDGILEQITVSVFPNPANTELTVALRGEAQSATAIITDVNGSILRNVELRTTLNTIDVYDFPSGLYFITLQIGTTSAVKRFVKY